MTSASSVTTDITTTIKTTTLLMNGCYSDAERCARVIYEGGTTTTIKTTITTTTATESIHKRPHIQWALLCH